jgi:hypothetical protein
LRLTCFPGLAAWPASCTWAPSPPPASSSPPSPAQSRPHFYIVVNFFQQNQVVLKFLSPSPQRKKNCYTFLWSPGRFTAVWPS